MLVHVAVVGSATQPRTVLEVERGAASVPIHVAMEVPVIVVHSPVVLVQTLNNLNSSLMNLQSFYYFVI